MIDSSQTEDFAKFAESLADTARRLMLEAQAMPVSIEYKDDGSPVTDLDRRIESEMRALIEARYPEHGIYGEEFENRNVDAEFVWVLDPIDGTAPFIAGIPVYGTLIALAHEGKPFLGVIEHPATSDRWVGASSMFARHNGRDVRVRRCERLNEALMTNSNPDFLNPKEMVAFTALKSQVRYVQYGGSCYSYAVLASGRTDLAIDGALDAFDVFAPIAVIEGAGGIVSDWAGQAIDIHWKGEILAAGCEDIYNQALAILADHRTL